MSADPRRYLVYWRDNEVLEVIDEPGPIGSRAAPSPRFGEKAIIHPFLSATALVPEHEGALREALENSSSLTEYLSILQKLGYRVVEQAE